MAIVSTVVLVTIGVGVAVVIAVIGNEIRLCMKEKKEGVTYKKVHEPIDSAMYLHAWSIHA